jgi:hypothetical protein
MRVRFELPQNIFIKACQFRVAAQEFPGRPF